VTLAPTAVRKLGKEVGDQREPQELTHCPGAGARRAGLGGPSCVVVAQIGGEERQVLEATLEQGGFNVVPADDGVAALELVCAVGPDAIIADLDGCDLDGLVLCQVLRGLRAHAKLPVLVLTTAHVNTARSQKMRDLGAVRVMHKPVRFAAVAGALSEMVNIVGAPAMRPPLRRAAFR
jgi:CheY-like chemotaxis protein